jgi:hypothetical protein
VVHPLADTSYDASFNTREEYFQWPILFHTIPQWVSFEVSHISAKLDFILKTMFLKLLWEYMIMWYLLQSFRVNFAKCMYCCIPHINSFTTEEWNH